MFDREVNKHIKDWYQYLMATINSSEFLNFCKTEQEDEENFYLTSIQNDPRLASHTDFFDDSFVKVVQICDIVDNNGFSKLINKIHKISKDYKVNCRYRKSKIINKYDYVHLSYEGRRWGKIAHIKFPKSSKYIDKIDILSSQLNNYFCLIEYEFHFKSNIDDSVMRNFILEYIPQLSNKDFRPFYILQKDPRSTTNFRYVREMMPTLFTSVCQHFITSLLYSDIGKQVKLPSLTSHTRSESFNIDTFVNPKFNYVYYCKELNFAIVENINNNEFDLFAGNNQMPELSISKLVWQYGNDFYFLFLRKWFLNYFQNTYSKYVDRKWIPNKGLSSLLKLYYGLTDTSFANSHGNIIENFNSKWELYFGFDKIEFEDESQQILSKFKEIFKNAYEHCKAQLDIKTNKIGRIISYVALVISLLSVIIGIVLKC